MQHFEVYLSPEHTDYSSVQLRRRYESLPDYTVIWIDTERFMACFERDHFVIPPVSEWDEAKLNHVRDTLRPDRRGLRLPEMPVAHLRLVFRTVYSGFWGFFKLFGQQVNFPVIAFSNGRHRSRYLQYAGAKTFPVEIELSNLELVRLHCGV
ncbi:MAG: hypothetical protein Q7T74_07215, partial [Candidatus Saccharibacteria bacterium]|nr:hypothetical protein [Candidatus Saccharibacteria bacterium]